ncbi:hypothetical protein V8C37DRAFT_371245, partial [Trichoderma ceciliae]
MQSRDSPPSWAWIRIAFHALLFKLTPRWPRRSRKSGRMHIFRRHPPVYCIADLIEPPPRYQHVPRTPPVVGELEMLQAELYRCQTQSSGGNPIERELLNADVENLNRWIEQLEYLVYYEAATTIPQRYQRESVTSKIFKRLSRNN